MRTFQKVLFSLLLGLFSTNAIAQAVANEVFVMEIRDNIDPRMNRYVELALEQAREMNASHVVVDMDTYGGAVNDADDIRTMLLEFEKPVYVFINNNAASAGALISIACDSIYMKNGANIGAATVVMGNDGTKAPDKYQSYMRSMMRSTAEAQGRDPRIAEAMVDENLLVEGVSDSGQVITFTATEAIQFGYCDGIVNSIDEIMALNNIEDYQLHRYELSAAEKIIAFFLNPMVSGVLILVILGGIYFELQTPGIGFPLAAAIVAAVLYFTPYYLNGLAENWEIVLFVVGLLLLAAEIFVIPGFGVAGISGITLTVGSLVLVMLDNNFFDFTFVPDGQVFKAVSAALGGTLGAIVVMFFGAARLSQSSVFKRVALQESMSKSEGYTSKFNNRDLGGLTGTAFTVLRPSGKVLIAGEIYDAFTRGDYISKGDKIVVVSDEGNSLKVRKIEDELDLPA